MTSQQTGFRPGSKTDWRKRLAPVTHYIDDIETCLEQANSALSRQCPAPLPACGEVKDPHPQDMLCKIKNKLIAVTDLFNFYDSLEFYNKPASFRTGAIDGAIRIIDDCIDKLDNLFQK